jgi:hypothetical protein
MGPSEISVLSRINPISHIDTYFFKMYSDILILCLVKMHFLKIYLLQFRKCICYLLVWPNFLDLLLTLCLLDEGYKLRSFSKAFSAPHSHSFRAKIFSSRTSFPLITNTEWLEEQFVHQNIWHRSFFNNPYNLPFLVAIHIKSQQSPFFCCWNVRVLHNYPQY